MNDPSPTNPRVLFAAFLAVITVILPAWRAPVSVARATDNELLANSIYVYVSDYQAMKTVHRGLTWLATQQLFDGSFRTTQREGNTATPSFAVLAFIAAGHEPSKGTFAPTIRKSIDYVLESQHDSGLISRTDMYGARLGVSDWEMYQHAVSTLMLSEVRDIVDAPTRIRIDAALAAAVKFTIRSQSADPQTKGGWPYDPAAKGCSIIPTCWQMLALRAAANRGVNVPHESIEAALGFVRRCVCMDGGFSCWPSGDKGRAADGVPVATGAAVLLLDLFGDVARQPISDEESKYATAGGDWLLAHPIFPNGPQFAGDCESAYFAARAASQLGSQYTWKFVRSLRDRAGGFSQEDGSIGGSPETTALAVMALCVSPIRAQPPAAWLAKKAPKAPAVVHEPIAKDKLAPEVRASVEKALQWFSNTQKADGTFPNIRDGDPTNGTTDIPSLAVLAFMAAGHVPGQSEYGAKINLSIDYVLGSQQASGLISRTVPGSFRHDPCLMFDHVTSTIMLSRVHGLVDNQRRAKIEAVLKGAVRFLIRRQHKDQLDEDDGRGGWGNSLAITPSPDLRITSWALLALCEAADCGIPVPLAALKSGVQFVDRCGYDHDPRYGFLIGFGEHPNGIVDEAHTAMGILTLESFRCLDPLLRTGQHAKKVRNGIEFLAKEPPARNSAYAVVQGPNVGSRNWSYLGAYLCAQVFDKCGGKLRDDYWPVLRTTLLQDQEPDGYFGADRAKKGMSGADGRVALGDRVYRTSFAIMALCAPSNAWPIHERAPATWVAAAPDK